MTFRFVWFVLFISVCCAENDYLEGSGEGSGEGDLLNSENLWQLSTMQQNDDGNDVLEFTGTYPMKEGCGVDLLFLLDTSGSLEQIYTQHINWTTQLTEALLTDKDEVHIAMIQYAEIPIIEFSFGTYRDLLDINNHIMTINLHSGGTRTGKALLAAKDELFSEEKGARKNASKIIVLFTDGLSVDDPIKHAQQLREIEKVKIYVVYVGSDGFEQEMNRIAGGRSNVFGPKEFTRLRKILVAEVENAETCESQKEWEIPSATIKTMINTTGIESPRSSDQITILTKLHTTSRTRTSTAAYPTSHKSLTKDTQLKHKSKKILVKQQIASKDQDVKLSETNVHDKINDENIDEAPINIVSVDEQFVGVITIPQQSIFSKDRNKSDEESENSVTLSTLNKKLRKERPRTEMTTSSTNHSFTEGREISRSVDHSSNKMTLSPRHVTVQHISTARKLGKTGSAGNIEKSQGQCPREILFIVDSSGSVQRIYDQQKEYLLSLLNELRIGEGNQRVALIQFAGSSHQRVEWTFDTYKDIKDIAEALNQVRHFTGTTYIGRALENSIGVLETRRQGIPTTVILVSDGFSQDDASKPAEEIRRMSNVDFYVVSMSQLNNFEYLTKLTDDPSKVYVGPRSEDLKRDLLSLIHCRT
uniref:von Willebrand factor type A domain-containing protein n=1 Tax=Wuchereria bancrofti TaxID=6293 RepID=A0AAF5PG94_WUCBA